MKRSSFCAGSAVDFTLPPLSWEGGVPVFDAANADLIHRAYVLVVGR